MYGVRYATTMARYNRWMNDRLYELASGLTDQERKADVGAFFKSVHGTFNHILLADRVWLGRFTGERYEFNSLDQQLYADFDELRRERVKTDDAILEWAGALHEADLERELAYTSITSPEKRSYPMWFVISHFFNHQTHHRGQVTTLLKQKNIDPGVTDLLRLPQL